MMIHPKEFRGQPQPTRNFIYVSTHVGPSFLWHSLKWIFLFIQLIWDDILTGQNLFFLEGATSFL